METKDFVIIAVVAVVVVVLISLFLLLFFKKRGNKGTEKEILNESKDLIALNAQKIEALLVLAKDNHSLKDELRSIQNQLKYLSPSKDERVQAIDEKIKDELDDLKIELSKKDHQSRDGKIETHFDSIRLKIAERSNFTDRL